MPALLPLISGRAELRFGELVFRNVPPSIPSVGLRLSGTAALPFEPRSEGPISVSLSACALR